ncbi:beta-hexosaminidase subunit alpha-like [Amphibalanus amphitrite]|uniref:beta-hexosaminidase subunit alpha-like n=1 Tax=Amphibalanus amphitrite TaxID=1232801 RepID=UPI001C91C864|nr:beta-hexosaminidase subunit alpha-like [Amphibalanus amphitrite]
MLRHWLLTSVAAGLCSCGWAGFPAVEPTQGEPWPAPSDLQLGDTALLIPMPDQLEFRVTGHSCDSLTAAISRYQAIVAGLAAPRPGRRRRPTGTPARRVSAELARVDVNLTTECSMPYPEFGMDESYRLEVASSGATSGLAALTADTLWGVLRGLETLVQLMYANGVGGLYVREASGSDGPRYSHRGILLDTARHFYPVTAIKDMLDVMAINKFNVFHWHIVDDQSFPFVSETFPALAEGGAYAEDMVYSQQQVQDIIEFARLRGIRVIPEFDTPGHTRSWGVGLPGFTTACYGADGQPDGSTGPVDPSNEDVYTMLSIFLTEISERFPDNYIHLGGDEVRFGFDCWLSNPQIVAWMQSLNITTPEEVENVFFQRLLDLVADIPGDVQYVVWQDAVDNNVTVRPDTIVEVWKGGWQVEMDKLTAQDLRVILSSPWYLDYISYGSDWHTYYDTEPESFGGSAQQNALVIGGEACMWSELVDETNLMARLWPRASAVAERLWSPKGTVRTDFTASRMEEHRCRMVKRGYKAQPANGPGFC